MESYSDEEDVQFFDTREDISDLGSDGSEDCSSSFRVRESGLDSFGYEFWTKNLGSVDERRHKFVKWMGLGVGQNSSAREESEDVLCDRNKMGIERVTENSGAVLRSSNFEETRCSSRSFVSCQSNDAMEMANDCGFEQNVVYKIKNLDNGKEFIVDELGQNGMLSRLREVGSNRSVTIEEFQKTFGSSHLVQQLLRREVDEAKKLRVTKKKVKRGWLKRLRAVGCIADGKTEVGFEPCDHDSTVGARIQRVRVHPQRKKSKELSSLFAGQDFPAHEGSILTMKFSPDGRYLASAGEDRIVRVWKVIEVERSNEFDIADIDPLNVYYTVNHVSKLASLNVDKDTSYKMKIVRRSSDSACVVFPPKVFRLSEKPLHEFHGHSGEVLDLSWSKKQYLLSSSVDKTVRLWQVGRHRCLRIFSHNNYVTCIGFNPVDDNYFISGSIDGKVRIWNVLGCRVVDWIDIREIVTAVSYRPDGKGGIVGSMTGNCRLYDIIGTEDRLYDIIDNHLELDAQICLQGKKKLQGKKITGFQFSPSDLSKVLVTSVDSVVRILSGVNVICKFKGLRNAGSHISASFTSDGKHIVSASEESNVYVWNYTSQDRTTSKAKNISSCESFLSHNASIAIPWCGMNSMLSALPSPTFTKGLAGSRLENGNGHHHFDEHSHHERPFPGHLLESLPKGTATWPEEKLSNSKPLSPVLCKSGYRFLKSACHSMSSLPHMWGLVIVTAGWDGRIRTYQNYGVPIRL